jgi:uncharacterized protein YbaP (TraB family)
MFKQRRVSSAVILFLTYGGLLVFGLFPRALPAQEKSFLWKVSKEGKNAYLLGSIHYLKRENFPLKKNILDALDRSKKLVLEINLNSLSTAAIQRTMLERAVYRDGTTLAQNIDGETYRRTEERASQIGIDIKVLEPMKPWFVALTMMAFKLQQLGLDAELGVDRQLAERAKGKGMPTGGLETFEFQIRLLDQLSKREQEMMLRETVAELESLDKNIQQIVQAWLGGDGATLERLMLAGMREYPELHSKVVVERNRRWLPEIEGMIARGENAMIVVGAAHLVGQEGVLELLKGRGYSLEQQ